MSEMKREYGYLFNENLAIEKRKEKEQERKEKEKAELKTETATEGIFIKSTDDNGTGYLKDENGYYYIEGVLIHVQVEHEGIIDFNIIGLQFELMKREEQYQAIDFVSKLCSGDKIVYWTRGAKIHDPRKWFFKIELR